MASINGISVKGMKNFKGHEGEPLSQGNVYLGNKKIGFWSQDSHGGPDSFILDPAYSETALNIKVKEINADKARMVGKENDKFLLEYDLEMLMFDFLNLKYEEEAYKQAVKQGYSVVMIVSDGYHQVTWGFP